MGRLGERDPDAVLALLAATAAAPEVELAGLWTHFATADELDSAFFDEQLERFLDLALPVRERYPEPPPARGEQRRDAARTGLAPRHGPVRDRDLRARPVRRRPVRAGPRARARAPLLRRRREALRRRRQRRLRAELASAGRDRGRGAADRLRRRGPAGAVQQRARSWSAATAGRSWARSRWTTSPSTSGPGRTSRPGAPAVLIGAQGDERILAEELAERLGTINYEITCGISPRVPARGRRGAMSAVAAGAADRARGRGRGARARGRRPMPGSSAGRCATPCSAATSSTSTWRSRATTPRRRVASPSARAGRRSSSRRSSGPGGCWRRTAAGMSTSAGCAATRSTAISTSATSRSTRSPCRSPTRRPSRSTRTAGRGDLGGGVLRAVSEPQLRRRSAARPAGGPPRRRARLRARRRARRSSRRRSPTAAGEPAGERQLAELRLLVGGPDPLRGLALLDELGATAAVLPELDGLRGVVQNPNHHLDVHGHTLEVLARLLEVERDLDRYARRRGRRARASCSPSRWPTSSTAGDALRFAALLHDVGKPTTRQEHESGFVTFVGHDREGAAIVARGLRAAEDEPGALALPRRRSRSTTCTSAS